MKGKLEGKKEETIKEKNWRVNQRSVRKGKLSNIKVGQAFWGKTSKKMYKIR